VAPFAWSRMIESIPAESERDRQMIERMRAQTPEKIAPLVVYLASDAARAVSGQIFGVRKNEIYLFSQPRPVETLKRPEGWTPALIADALEGPVKEKLTPLEGTGQYFKWEPV
jgi:hypothetical protein